MLNDSQREEFKSKGYLKIPGLIPESTRKLMLDQLSDWVEESRSYDANYGFDTPNGKARFDLEQSHSSDHPRLRRVANPVDISEAYQSVLFFGKLPEVVADLIGPDVFFSSLQTE